jgi:signal peptidase II
LDRAYRSTLTRATGLVFALLLAALVFAVDQGIKSLVESTMRLGESIELIPGLLSLTYIENDGGAFGLLGGRAAILLLGSAAAVLFVLWTLLSRPPSPLVATACGLILGGAAGNLFDRLTQGAVTDYVHFSFWYIFNAADAAIVVGVGLLLISALLPDRETGTSPAGEMEKGAREGG